MDISELVARSHEDAIAKGWWAEGDRPFAELIALAHSELSEALEAYRDGMPVNKIVDDYGKPVGVPIEFADLVIRVADTCAYLGIDLQYAIKVKMAFNKTRPTRHGGKLI